ncbi:hypothetical protein [Actinophytocola sp.]|jgi:hypothetical protein|uniref:hypothetical protein n=1 Tax=Actinophytocola sp. TaxID=1872138 RepID=UPI002EDA039C
MTSHGAEDRMRMPGEGPTDEDLRMDAELTRQELAQTVAALGAKADLKTRVRAAARERAEAIQAGGAELVSKLPDPVAQRVAPVWTTVSHRPAISLAGLVALIAMFGIWLRARRR